MFFKYVCIAFVCVQNNWRTVTTDDCFLCDTMLVRGSASSLEHHCLRFTGQYDSKILAGHNALFDHLDSICTSHIARLIHNKWSKVWEISWMSPVNKHCDSKGSSFNAVHRAGCVIFLFVLNLPAPKI